MRDLEALVPAALAFPDDLDRHRMDPAGTRGLMRTLLEDATGVLGSWPRLVDYLMSIGRTDIPTARLIEAHVDALRIHAEAGTRPVEGALYAVWASRSHATGLRAARSGESWTLDGTLRFTSGSGIVDRALVPVWIDPDTHVLLDLDVSGWSFDGSRWRTRAMAPARSHEIVLRELVTTAPVVGPDDFYLERPGFFRGGVGVAAAWAGGACRVLDLALAAVPAERRTPAQAVRFGRVATDLLVAVSAVREAARKLPDPTSVPRLLPTLARSAVAGAARRVLSDVRALVGPAGLAFDEDLTRAVDDLFLFVAQHNEDADAAWIGGEL